MAHHKEAGDLELKDRFSMGGAHYEVLAKHTTNRDDRVRIRFVPVQGGLSSMYTMDIDPTTLFFLV